MLKKFNRRVIYTSGNRGSFFSTLFLIISLALGFSSSCLAQTDNFKSLTLLDRTVATVNNETITESELNRQVQFFMLRLKQSEATMPSPQEFRKQVLERMITEKIQLQLAKLSKIEIDEETLDKTVQDIAERDNLTLEQLSQFLDEQGIPFSHFKESIKTELTLHRLHQQEIGQRIVLSKSEVENFVNSPVNQDKSGTEYRLAHILLPIPEEATSEEIASLEKEAEALVKDIKKGSNFETIAKNKSAGQQASVGGDLGWRKLEEIPTLFMDVSSKMAIGQAQGPFKNESGFHIIKLMDKRIGGEPITKPHVEAHLRQILIRPEGRTEQDAQNILGRIRGQLLQGASFAQLAQRFSEDESKAKEGDLGWVTASSMPAFRKQISELKSGEISEPFKSEEGWHLVQVMERRSAQATSDTAKQKAMDALYQRKFEEKLTRWVKQLRQEANVQIYLNDSDAA